MARSNGAKRPNILFILTDDQRADTIRAWGNDHIHTPALDGLARRGTCFRNAYIMGGTQPAVCCPSRNMILTGRSMFRIGEETGETIPAEHITLPELLRGEGYHAHHIGKWHQDRQSFHRSYSGADRIFGFNPGWYVQHGGQWNVAVHDFDPTGAYPTETGYLLAEDKKTHRPLKPAAGGVHSSEMFSDAAIAFLARHARGSATDRPFFLYLAYTAPHDPRQAPEEYKSRYDAANMRTPPNFLERHPFDNGEFTIRDEMLEGWPRRPHAVRRHIADYYAGIEFLDAQIGRVLAALHEYGLEDSTIVVFASDNGLAIGSHGLIGKQNLYEHSVRVPLIFAGPGVPVGKTRSDFCYLLDVYPTLCGMTGTALPSSVEGHDLTEAVRGSKAGGRKSLYFGYRGVQRAVRNERHKLIEYVTEEGSHTQLFDLAHDRYETHDLSGEADCARIVEAMRGEVRQWRRATGDDRKLEAAFWEGFGGA